jgi:hypothetical protein
MLAFSPRLAKLRKYWNTKNSVSCALCFLDKSMFWGVNCFSDSRGKIMKRLIMAFALFCATTFHVHAGTYTGIWWNQNESGWGITFTQQFDTLFAAMYVYNSAGQPTWFTATLKPTNPNVPNNYTGDLFTATGPFYGGPFVSSQVTGRRVGTMTFNASTFLSGTLTYTADGSIVTKPITPFTFTGVPGGGTYAVTFLRDGGNNCNIPAFSAVPTQLVVGPTSIQLLAGNGASICSASGSFLQAGAMYSFQSTSPSCFPGGRLAISDLRIEGIAGLTNNNIFLTGVLLFQDGAQSCISLYYTAGIRTN